jgi:ankyrin repeat protein
VLIELFFWQPNDTLSKGMFRKTIKAKSCLKTQRRYLPGAMSTSALRACANCSQSRYVLHESVRLGHMECLQLQLMVPNVDVVNQQDEPNGRTPLHTAAEFGRKLCIDLLLKHKADQYVKVRLTRTDFCFFGTS